MKDLTSTGADSGFPSCLLCRIPTTDAQAVCPECRRKVRLADQLEATPEGHVVEIRRYADGWRVFVATPDHMPALGRGDELLEAIEKAVKR